MQASHRAASRRPCSNAVKYGGKSDCFVWHFPPKRIYWILGNESSTTLPWSFVCRRFCIYKSRKLLSLIWLHAEHVVPGSNYKLRICIYLLDLHSTCNVLVPLDAPPMSQRSSPGYYSWMHWQIFWEWLSCSRFSRKARSRWWRFTA